MKTPSILDGIRVASPCQAGWDSMSGDDLARFCSLCSKNVYNLSAMTTAEAVAFVADREGESCVRFYRRADGTTLTSDCPVGASKARSSRLRKIAGLGVVGLAMGSTVLAAVGLGSGSEHPASFRHGRVARRLDRLGHDQGRPAKAPQDGDGRDDDPKLQRDDLGR